jgi:hypothetical protein
MVQEHMRRYGAHTEHQEYPNLLFISGMCMGIVLGCMRNGPGI